MARPQAPPPLPLWHRSRWLWVNGLGFAITLALVLAVLLSALNALRADADPFRMPYPTPFLVAAGLALLATLLLMGVIVFRYAWHGLDLADFRPRLYLFLWTCAGGLYFLVQGVIWLRFGRRSLPNVAAWGEDVLWLLCPIGVLTFAVLGYVNSDLPGREVAWHPDDDEDPEDDPHADEEPAPEPRRPRVRRG